MKKILIIDDDDVVRENTVEYLKEEGFEVYTACNGKKGLALAEKLFPDLIICDIAMPKLSGIEVFKTLKNNPILKQIPFLFFTASSKNDKKETGIKIDDKHFMFKPFDYDELKERIELLIN
jgi:DNA-binding response OmpR family regulator